MKIIKKLFTVATEKKHIFNDGDNAIYLKNDGLVVQNQNYGYYIKKAKNELTLYAFSNDGYKKHKNLAKLIKEIESDKPLSLIDNVAVKITDGKVVFGDYLFTYMNLMQDMEIAKDEIQNMQPRKSTMKRKM